MAVGVSRSEAAQLTVTAPADWRNPAA
jgi:hypothetical protein